MFCSRLNIEYSVDLFSKQVFFTVIVALLEFTDFDVKEMNSSLVYIIILWMIHVFHFFPLLLAVLKLHIAVISFQQIKEDISKFIQDQMVHSDQDIERKLKKWKSQHILVYKYVAQWSKMFNYILLVDVSHIFFCLLSSSRYMLQSLSLLTFSGQIYFIIDILKNGIIFFLLCFTANRVKDEVFKLKHLHTWS